MLSKHAKNNIMNGNLHFTKDFAVIYEILYKTKEVPTKMTQAFLISIDILAIGCLVY